MSKKKLKGTIISDKTAKTLVVKVERIKKHPKYKKRFKTHKNYKAHYEGGDFQVGDKVLIEETKPISREKHWRAVEKI